MCSNPLVSIIVLSYNHAHFIDECLDSVFNQSYSNIELIVGDDASSDTSVEAFENYLQNKNIVVKKNYHKVNTGLATMLNECMSRASGKYLKIIAADDFLHKDYIAKCVKISESNPKAIVFSNAFEVNNDSKIVSPFYFKVPVFFNREDMIAKLVQGNYVPGSTLFMSMESMQAFGLYSKDTLLEDYHFALTSIRNGYDLKYIDENLVYYRRHVNNITSIKFNLLEVETIKEKIKFDVDGRFRKIINSNIIKQIKLGNNLIKNVLRDYYTYNGMSKTILVLLKMYPISSNFIRILSFIKSRLDSFQQ